MSSEFEQNLDKYAEVIVRVGLNLQPGQRLLIGTPGFGIYGTPIELVHLGGNPSVVICSQGIARSPSEASFLPFYSQFSPRKAGIWRSLASVGTCEFP